MICGCRMDSALSCLHPYFFAFVEPSKIAHLPTATHGDRWFIAIFRPKM